MKTNAFTDYLITVVAVGGGIVALKVLMTIVATKWLPTNAIAQDVNNVFLLM